MDGPPFVVPFITATLLRLGVPLLLTYGAAWLLRRLDARWQSEAGAKPQAVKGNPGISCWLLQGCQGDVRDTCPAYQDRSIPCWQHFRDGRGRMESKCLNCPIFRRWLAPEPA